MNLLAQAQDGYAFLTQMVKIPPRRAHILIGPIAELIGAINGGAAFAACGAYNSTVMQHILTPLLFGLGLPSGLGLALDRVDI
ncbi:MAG: hypothetical protein L0Z62_29380, partial [Gemmataceae bacterium]|nr:hypothetical protein [Gemmataceae bacterium]